MNRCTVIIGLVLAVSALGPVAGSGAARAGEPTVTVVSWHRSGGREYLALRLCVAPAGTDPAIIAAVNHSIAKAISGNTVAEGYGRVGFTPESSTQEQLQSYLVSETAKYKTVIATAGITPE